MKTSTLPPVRVDPALREAAESVLGEGETLSSFVETSLRAQIDKRVVQREFVARGLASAAEARRTGVYYTADEVIQHLRMKVDSAKRKAGKGRSRDRS